jgi:lysozyme family protein
MQVNFDKCLGFTLQYEGGFANNPNDPGGATNMGITHLTLAAYRRAAITTADVQNLSREEAAAIYKILYWDHVNGDNLPAGVDLAVFDYAVNSGTGRAARALQSILGVAVDGSIGPATLAALAQADAKQVASAVCAHRLSFLERLSTFHIFGHGWTSRVNACRIACAGMN